MQKHLDILYKNLNFDTAMDVLSSISIDFFNIEDYSIDNEELLQVLKELEKFPDKSSLIELYEEYREHKIKMTLNQLFKYNSIWQELNIDSENVLFYLGNSNKKEDISLFEKIILNEDGSRLIKVLSNNKSTLLFCKNILLKEELLNKMINLGLSLNDKNQDGVFASCYLLRYNIELAMKCIDKKLIDINLTSILINKKYNSYSKNGFFYEFIKEYSNIPEPDYYLDKILNFGLNLNDPNNVYLYASLNSYKYELANKLIKRSASILNLNEAKSNLLYFNGNEKLLFTDILDIIEIHKEDLINYRNAYNINALPLIIKDGRYETATWLIENGEKVNIQECMEALVNADKIKTDFLEIYSNKCEEDFKKNQDYIYSVIINKENKIIEDIKKRPYTRLNEMKKELDIVKIYMEQKILSFKENENVVVKNRL